MSTPVHHPADFLARHLGPGPDDIQDMLETVGCETLDDLMEEAVPSSIRLRSPLRIPEAVPEAELIRRLREIAAGNEIWRSYLGMGYSGTITPGVIQRNILENPGWYTQYTPYQAEIAQGRLEALLNFQTTVIDLTGLEIANASLLDEATAAAEAMFMLYGMARRRGGRVFLVAEDCHPQTIGVVETRAEPLGIEVRVGPAADFVFNEGVFGALVQYPATDGGVHDYSALCEEAHAAGSRVVVAADLMSLLLLTPPGDFGADVAVGSAQRFGVPMGYGGPHAGYIACREKFKRQLPGRIIGVSVDRHGNRALRMALQTREQHIRREKATSNICTAQVLLAVMAGMYAVYHGPGGLRRIAERIRKQTATLARGLEGGGNRILHDVYFDTLRVRPASPKREVLASARALRINLRDFGDRTVGIALDETVTAPDLDDLLAVFGAARGASKLAAAFEPAPYPAPFARSSDYLTHPVFNSHHSETEMLRYIRRLESRDLSLNTSMIPLGSCTMKLNATTQMTPVTWPEFGALHPFAPVEQARGYSTIISDLKNWLAEISGLPAVSLQPNSGAQGEYTGLLVIRARQRARGQAHRDICLIPSSAHGTNPASAVLAGMKVVVVRCDERGNVDVDDLAEKAKAHSHRLAAVMVTYPSTHGVFEEEIRKICDIVHQHGGYVYLDGANLNAQVGLCRPGDYGADVIHINLHKTFAIPHGGGGPGMGPICATAELAPYLPGHPVIPTGGASAISPVSAAPWGSASILLISWAYIALLGREGTTEATRTAILSANYMATRLEEHFDVLFWWGSGMGRVAHEFIIDLRPLKRATGITEEDVAKRLMDYGFHAPTVAFPVPGTMMIEPTESESKAELDRFCAALISIRAEIEQVELGLQDRQDNALKNAPHTAAAVTADRWEHGYTRSQAAFPAPWLREHKFWPHVGRVNNAHGDRNLVCACEPIEAYMDAETADSEA
ncbi:MAG: aminomethyl-transferring glycine dehydrogenase [Gemmatimonadetes bacterium]|nr:aminomethyl-transferring glycine dehydrogenase [Gemmatimonadota bacterium]MYE69948.1 aminomethyl-transferring glycine dehydrogenase [Gemmatimonadota bacterium]MYJ67059.1 aminomethyl-transferring glycine dehydrogenase [Gemmatimonadota bacterium]